MASWNHTSRPSFISQGSPVERTTKIVSTEGTDSISGSTALLMGAVLPLRRAPSTVTSALASENSMRSRTASGEKPPKTTL